MSWLSERLNRAWPRATTTPPLPIWRTRAWASPPTRIEVKQLGLATGQVVRVRHKRRIIINVRYIP